MTSENRSKVMLAAAMSGIAGTWKIGNFDDRDIDHRLMGVDWGFEPGYVSGRQRAPKCADPKKKAKRKMQAASRRRNRR